MNYLDRKNAATFRRCQARYDNQQHPDYYAEDPPPCEICGYDTDGDKREEKYLCPDCIKEYYSCPECEAEYWHKSDTKNELCDDCKAESWGE
jgi:hypothetical protein